MKVIFATGKEKFKSSVAAIGIFDGVHRGHQYLIKAMLQRANRLSAKSLVITFYPHPVHVLCPKIKLQYISSLNERVSWLESMGVEICLVIAFDKKFAHIKPEDFIQEMLVKQLGVKAVYVGEDFKFGKDRRGDAKLFSQMAHQLNFEFHAMTPLLSGKQPISSTRIRRYILDGKLSSAARLLGRSFSITGNVIKGEGRGKGLGFPTANLDVADRILPPLGVYAVRMRWRGRSYNAVANLGVRPSFKTTKPKVSLEVHVFDFSQKIYGQEISVEFIQKIRPERKFDSPQNLIEQIRQDIAAARELLRKSP